MAEIEWFVDPEDKSYAKFKREKDTDIPLWSRELQMSNKHTVMVQAGVAVNDKLISNETLGYFMVRTYKFLQSIGIQKQNLRFRQHLIDEMAH